MLYAAQGLYDGTVLTAYPVRKSTPHVITRDNLKIDDEGITNDCLGAGRELSDVHNDTRTRFQDTIAISLNTPQAIRDLVLPEYVKLHDEMLTLREQMEHIEKLLTKTRLR